MTGIRYWLLGIGLPVLFVSPLQAQDKLSEGLVNPGYHEPPTWFLNSFLDLREDIADAKQRDKRLVLYFFQDGCPYCKKLLEINFAQKDIVDLTRSRFEVLPLNMWGDREVTAIDGQVMSEKQFAEQMRVMFTPTLLFLDENGKAILRVNGYYPPHKFRAALSYVSGRHETTETFRDYFKRLAPPAARGQLRTDPLFLPAPHKLDQRESGKPLMVIFEQKDCPSCDEMHDDVLPRPTSRTLMKRFDVVQLDMWSSKPKIVTTEGKKMTAAEWARQLNIQYAPTIIFFDENGQEVIRAEAWLKSFHTQSLMDYVASGAWRKQSNFQRYIEERADHIREQGGEIDLLN